MGSYSDGVASANDYLAARRAESAASDAMYAASRAESRAREAEGEVRRLQAEVQSYSSALATMRAVEAGYMALCTAFSEAAADPMNPTMGLKNQRTIARRAREIVANSQSVDPIAIQRAWRSERMQKVNDRFSFVPPETLKPPVLQSRFDLPVPVAPGEIVEIFRPVAVFFVRQAWEFGGQVFKEFSLAHRAKADAEVKYSRGLLELEERLIVERQKADANFTSELKRYKKWLEQA